MAEDRPPRRARRERGAAAPTPAAVAQLEGQIEGLRTQLGDITARNERAQKDNEELHQTIATLDQLLLQREAEEEDIEFPEGDRGKWFKEATDVFKKNNQLVKSIEDVLIDDTRRRLGLDPEVDRITVMHMLEQEQETGDDQESMLPMPTAPKGTKPAIQNLGSSIRRALLGSLRGMTSSTSSDTPPGPIATGPSSFELFSDDQRMIGDLKLSVAALNSQIRSMRDERRTTEEENMILRNMYIDLREDQAEAYARIQQLSGEPWKLDPPGAFPGGDQFARTAGGIEQIQKDRAAAEEARYAALSDVQKREFDRRELEEQRRVDDAAALSRERERLEVVTAASGSTAPARLPTDTGSTRGTPVPKTGTTGGNAPGDQLIQAQLRLVDMQERFVILGEELDQQRRNCEDEKGRMLADAERNNRAHEEDKRRLREQNRRDHERCEREKQVLRDRIASMRAQIDRLTIPARLYEQQTAGLGQATARAPHLEEIHVELERVLQLNADLQALNQRQELRINLLEGNTPPEDVAVYQAMATGVEEMRQLMSSDDLREELDQNRDALERSLNVQQSLGQAMRGLMDFVVTLRTRNAAGALARSAEALQAVSRMHNDFQELERRWAGVERGGTSNAMLRRKLRKTIARAATLRIEEIEDLTAENDSLRAQLAENNSIVDLQRWRTVNKEIEIIESEILESGPHPLTPPRDLLRLARLQTEKLRMMPCPDLRQFAISLQKEAIPTIHDLPDDYFFRQWNDLYDNVRAWCTTYYSLQETSTRVGYEHMVRDVQLLSFYLRDVLIHRDYVPLFLNNTNGRLPTGRADVATAIVFRILVEEIFEPVRFMIGLRFTDATHRWKFKKQYKVAFEVRDMRANAYQPRFQSKESFLERKRKQMVSGYLYPEVDEQGPPPKKRVKSSLQKFNFIRTFEDDEPIGTTRDNDDDIIMNTSRAKFMRTIFSLSTDPTNPQFKEMRSNVSNLIIDTLNPLGHTQTPARKTVPATHRQGKQKKGIPAEARSIHGATWRENPRVHKASLWEIIKRAYDLAIMMRCQRTNIHPLAHDLPSMMSFDYRHFTIVNYPEGTPAAERANMDAWFAQSSPGPRAVGCHGKPICEVLPALLRRGDPELGNYSWRDRVVIAKSKVYVGGPDDVENFALDNARNSLYTVAEYPFATDPADVPSGAETAADGVLAAVIGGGGGGGGEIKDDFIDLGSSSDIVGV